MDWDTSLNYDYVVSGEQSIATVNKGQKSQEILDKHIPFHRLGQISSFIMKINKTFIRKYEKKYSCSVCGLRFHLIQNMQRHSQTHGKSKKGKT